VSKRKSSGQKSAVPPWSVPVVAADIPEIGQRIELVADAPARAAIAATAGLAELPRLEAVFDLARHGRDGARVVGRVTADVVQNCVVTLEPLPAKIAEDIDMVFVPPGEPEADPDAPEVVVAETDDPPEVLQGGTIDLGNIATEFLLLGIDPYPRKAGATFEAPKVGDDPAAHPFAVLAALKKDRTP